MEYNPKNKYQGGYKKATTKLPNNGNAKSKLSNIVSPSHLQISRLYDTIVDKWIQMSRLDTYKVYQLYLKHDVGVNNRFLEIPNTNCSVSIAVLKGTSLDLRELAIGITRRMLKQYTVYEVWRCTYESYPIAFTEIYKILKDTCQVPNPYYFICTIKNIFVQHYMNLAYTIVHNQIESFEDRKLWIEEGCTQHWECTYELLYGFLVDVVTTFQLKWCVSDNSDFHLLGTKRGMYFTFRSHKALAFMCIAHLWKGKLPNSLQSLKNEINTPINSC